MGDILWAHLEMLQKDVDRERANLQNVPSGYSDSFANETNRTYFQLDSTSSSPAISSTSAGGQQPAPPPLVPSTSAAIAIAAQQANASSKPSYLPQTLINTSMALQYPNQIQQQRNSTTSVTSSLMHNPITTCSTPSESWNNGGSAAGSVADGSEYSYHGGNANMGSIANSSVEMKYSHQMAVAAASITSAPPRVPQSSHNTYPMSQYTSYPEYENNLWVNQHHQQHNLYQPPQSQQLLLNDQHNQQLQHSPNQWHQPTSTSSSDFHSVTNGKNLSPASSATISPPLGLNTLNTSSLSNHIHTANSITGAQQIVPGAGMHQHPAFLQVSKRRLYTNN